MLAEIIIGLVIMLYVAAVMLGIGISQYRSKKPVGFYSGEKPPKESELSDVLMWNKKHGKMWILYSVAIIGGYLSGIPFMAMDTAWCALPICGGCLIHSVFLTFHLTLHIHSLHK